MRIFVFFATLFFHFSLLAQVNGIYTFRDTVPANSILLKAGDNTVLIYQQGFDIGAQLWITFDSTLAVMDEKKLITPNATEIISQSYLEGVNTIIRIDQWMAEGRLHVSGYIFDSYGNMLYGRDITDSSGIPTAGTNSRISPFLVSQSEDKNLVALIRSSEATETGRMVSAIVFDNKIDIVKSSTGWIDYNPELEELHMPLVDNEGAVFLLTADMFNSFKLSSHVNCYILPAKDTIIVKKEFPFSRKKIKWINFTLADNKLLFSALYTKENSKTEIAGVLHAGYDYLKRGYLATKEYEYSTAIKKQLQKDYPGYKNNVLNYLMPLAAGSPGNIHSNYQFGILQPVIQRQPFNKQEAADLSSDGISQARARSTTETPFGGSSETGAATAMNPSEAGLYSSLRAMESYQSANEKIDYYPGQKSTGRMSNLNRNLLFFSLKDSQQINTYRFLKMRMLGESTRYFVSYVPDANGYSCIHYSSKRSGQPILMKSNIDNSGMVSEKILFNDKDKIILSGYPRIPGAKNLIAFYWDQASNETGIISIKL